MSLLRFHIYLRIKHEGWSVAGPRWQDRDVFEKWIKVKKQSLVLFLQLSVTFNPAGSYAVEGLKPDTLYMFSLAARSEMGLGVFTKPIEARTAQSSECSALSSCSISAKLKRKERNHPAAQGPL